MKSKQQLHDLEVPLVADSVDSPIVNYGGGLTSINFATREGGWGRVTFEKLDSIKVSRGEYEPYPSAPDNKGANSWVGVVSNSTWLLERYEYEKRCYGASYEFGGKVEEMLTDYSHYVFSFHDQFVEVLSAGIWFESSDVMLGNREPGLDHPLRPLPESSISERFESSGIVCEVRRNALPIGELERSAKYCSQTLLEVGAVLDGRSSTYWTLSLRVRNEVKRVSLRNYFGKAVENFDSIPTLTDIRPRVDEWLTEVRQRRKDLGKD